MAKKGGDEKPKGGSTILNRKARFEYHIIDTYEAGIVLVGSEVKSIWLGNANLADAYCRIKNQELWIMNMDVEHYEHTSHFAPERRRDRKLLLKKKELLTIERKAQEKGFTIIPLKAYFNSRGKVKIEIGLCQGKKLYDKRHQIAEKETQREKERMRSARGQY
jgi:SsrA-binding protein